LYFQISVHYGIGGPAVDFKPHWGQSHVRERGVPKTNKKDTGRNREIPEEGDGIHRKHGRAGQYEVRDDGPTLVHGDGKPHGNGELDGDDKPEEKEVGWLHDGELDGEREVRGESGL